jgi:hypothetical protein
MVMPVVSTPPRRRQKEAERRAINVMGENQLFAPLQFYFLFISLALSSLLIC